MSNLRNLSSFTLIVIFVCLSLIGGGIGTVAAGETGTVAYLARTDCLFQYARQLVAGD